MRDVREVMRLHREGAVAMREIARMTGVARSTVRDMILRFERSGLGVRRYASGRVIYFAQLSRDS